MRTFLYCESRLCGKRTVASKQLGQCRMPYTGRYPLLTNQFNVPESFLSDIADTDERPRIEYEGNWLLTIIRIPVQSQEQGIPFTTILWGL